MPTPSMTEPLLLSRRLAPLPAAAAPLADVAGRSSGDEEEGPSGHDRGGPLWVLALSAAERQRLRGHCRSACGRDLLLQLPRGGGPLEPDERLAGEDGVARVRVAAAPEELLVVRSDDPFTLLRAAYHLGNRHVALELRQGELRLLRDPVLEAMLRGLGVTVSASTAPFRPEGGAYGSGGHPHAHHADDGHPHGSRTPHSHGTGGDGHDRLPHRDNPQAPSDAGPQEAPHRQAHVHPS